MSDSETASSRRRIAVIPDPEFPVKRIATLMLSAACLLPAMPALAADEPPSTLDKVEGAIARGAQAAASGVARGVHAAASGIERGAKATARGIERGAKAAARGTAKGVDAAASGVKRGADATRRAVGSAADKVQGNDGASSPSN